MKITNDIQLPDPVMAALRRDDEANDANKAALTVTRILQPVRVRQLRLRHWEQVEEPASDVLYRFGGQIVHGLVSAGDIKDTEWWIERTLTRAIPRIDGLELSGTPDMVDVRNTVLWDLKYTSVWSFVYGNEDWVRQVNCYRWLLEPVLQIVAGKLLLVFRDWQETQARRDPTYPQVRAVTVDVPLWALSEVEHFVRERVTQHVTADRLDEGDLPECTPAERWVRDECWAVIKVNADGSLQKRAVTGGLCKTPDEALRVAAITPGKTHVVHRSGESKRCRTCNVRQWCSQFASMAQQTEDKGDAA